jgi:tRNA threonylcarbamoyladenosine biosynthesis protein TsaB
MRILAIETSTRAGGVALIEDGRVVGQRMLNIALTHSERLMALVEGLLRDSHWTPSDLEGLALSIGPGSFTGLRIGAATVKGLGLALGLPVAPVPTLDALAANLPFANAPVCPLLDARKGEVYLACYRWNGEAMVRESEYQALPPDLAVAGMSAPVIVLGDGVAACRPYFGALGDGLHVAPAAQSTPSAAVVGQIGHEMLAGAGGVSADEIVPLYLRPSEVELRARHG